MNVHKFILITILLVCLFIGILAWNTYSVAPDVFAQGDDPTTFDDNAIPPDVDLTETVQAVESVPNAPGDTLVYFTPQDSNGTGTVVTLYNTSAITVTVNIKAYYPGNILYINTNVTLDPGYYTRMISDSLAAGAPNSWLAPNSKLVNFTDNVIYAVLSVPSGVKLDGYVVFNAGTATIDPNADQGALPLRFSTDPLTVFLPTVYK